MAPTAAGNLAMPSSAAAILLLWWKGLSDPNGALANWDPDLVNPCTWFRVTCNGDNRVIRLDLQEMSLSGHLSADLARLDQLQFMEITSNNIEGSIPPEFGNLENLISLDLCNNTISGPIPPSLGKLKSLKFMRIDHNLLTGPIPNELVGLSNLTILFANNPRLRYPGMGAVDEDDTGC
uniref:Leucine-rich repeat-containing N-terminal plant-type domain-containing protein n=1 Tax=Oryza punctata TaxID=4537 RepID=A0A0E0L456_ORYPU